MIRNKLLLGSALMVMALAIPASAQRPATPAGQPTPTPAPVNPAASGTTTVALPTSKMAVIYTDMFLDSKNGIGKFNTAVTRLNSEFTKVRDEIAAMQARAQTLETEINKLREAPEGAPINQQALQAKIDQLDQLKKDIQRKAEDAQASYNRRRQEIFTPLQEEIGKAIEVFAKARGINAIIDGAQVPLLYAAESIDITRAFITDFNSKNPVTAATTTTTPPK